MFDKNIQKEKSLIYNGRSVPYNANNIIKARDLRKRMTAGERKLWYDFLRNHIIKFYRQRPIDHYIVDFYSPQVKLVIEVDGLYHSEKDQQLNDEIRTNLFNLYEIAIIRFTNNQIFDEFPEVCNIINSYITKTASPNRGGGLVTARPEGLRKNHGA